MNRRNDKGFFQILKHTCVFLFVIFVFFYITKVAEYELGNALYGIFNYVENGNFAEKINEKTYTKNIEEYTIRVLYSAKKKAINALIQKEYSDAYDSLNQSEKYLKHCTRVIYYFQLESKELKEAFMEAYAMYNDAKKYTENLKTE